MRLGTPEKIRELQRKLYQKAKQELRKPLEEDDLPARSVSAKAGRKAVFGAKLDRRETNRTYGLMRGSWR